MRFINNMALMNFLESIATRGEKLDLLVDKTEDLEITVILLTYKSVNLFMHHYYMSI